MSTRSFIAKEIGDDQYRTIYCHNDGYLTYNGAMLLDHYNTPELVDRLLDLGDVSSLGPKLDPDQDKPHSFDYNERQDGVTVAYTRDRGDNPKDTKADIMSMDELDDPQNWTEYVYIFTKDNEWKYFHANQSGDGLHDVKEDLENQYAHYGLSRPPETYGFIDKESAEMIKQEQPDCVLHDEQVPEDNPGPALTM
jgi:hypothetical protein